MPFLVRASAMLSQLIFTEYCADPTAAFGDRDAAKRRRAAADAAVRLTIYTAANIVRLTLNPALGLDTIGNKLLRSRNSSKDLLIRQAAHDYLEKSFVAPAHELVKKYEELTAAKRVKVDVNADDGDGAGAYSELASNATGAFGTTAEFIGACKQQSQKRDLDLRDLDLADKADKKEAKRLKESATLVAAGLKAHGDHHRRLRCRHPVPAPRPGLYPKGHHCGAASGSHPCFRRQARWRPGRPGRHRPAPVCHHHRRHHLRLWHHRRHLRLWHHRRHLRL